MIDKMRSILLLNLLFVWISHGRDVSSDDSVKTIDPIPPIAFSNDDISIHKQHPMNKKFNKPVFIESSRKDFESNKNNGKVKPFYEKTKDASFKKQTGYSMSGPELSKRNLFNTIKHKQDDSANAYKQAPSNSANYEQYKYAVAFEPKSDFDDLLMSEDFYLIRHDSEQDKQASNINKRSVELSEYHERDQDEYGSGDNLIMP